MGGRGCPSAYKIGFPSPRIGFIALDYRGQRSALSRATVALAAILCSAAVSNAAVTNIGWYRLGENDAGAASGALGGNPTYSTDAGWNLARRGSPYYTDDTVGWLSEVGWSSLAMRLDGSSAYYTTNYAALGTNNIGMEAWVKVQSYPATGYAGIVATDHGGATNGFALSINTSGQAQFEMRGVDGYTLRSTTAVPTNTWAHVAGVRDNNRMRLYLNGMLQTNVATLAGAGRRGDNCIIGALGPGGYGKLNGTVDEARFFTFAPGGFSRADLNCGSYGTGFVWNPKADWDTNDNVAGTSIGNPEPDRRGNPAWEYTYFSSGGLLTSATPWYVTASTNMTWNTWWTSGYRWTRGPGNTGPTGSQGILEHQATSALYEHPPGLRWTNTTGRTVLVRLGGTLNLTYNGGCSGNVDVAVVHAIGAGTFDPVWTRTFTGQSGSSITSLVERATWIDPGGSILATLRLHSPSAGWVNFNLQNLNITLPATTIWNRAADCQYDWGEGTLLNTTNGNPQDDAAGRAVWEHDWVSGGNALGSPSPWFIQPRTTMQWQRWKDHYAFVRGSNVSPHATARYVESEQGAGTNDYAGLIRWINPTGGKRRVDINGELRVGWEAGATSTNAEVTVALLYFNGVIDELFSTGVTHSASATEQCIPVSLPGIAVDAADSLFWSLRASGSSNGSVLLHDDGLSLSLSDVYIQTNTFEDVPLSIADLTGDPDFRGTNMVVSAAPSHGSVAILADGTAVYTPAADWWGHDSFSVKALLPGSPYGDRQTHFGVYTVSVNDAPVSAPDSAATASGASVNIDVLANDTNAWHVSDRDDEPLVVEVLSDPANGQLTVMEDGSVTYLADDGYAGTDTFTYRPVDAHGVAGPAQTVTVQVAVANKLYVDPNGDDANPGTEAEPLRSLAGARDRVRALGHAQPIEVLFGGGLYPVTNTVVFDQPSDSGTAGSPVIYRANRYPAGWCWNHTNDCQSDYAEGVLTGTANGNPMDDARRNGAWAMMWIHGTGRLASSNAWWRGTPEKMIYENWYGTPLFARGNNLPPDARPSHLESAQSVASDSNNYTPCARWVNPALGCLVSVTGEMVITWHSGATNDVDLAIVRAGNDDARTLLFGTNLTKTADNTNATPVNLSVELAHGDVLDITARGTGGPGWVSLRLGGLNIQLLEDAPEKAVIAGAVALPNLTWTNHGTAGVLRADLAPLVGESNGPSAAGFNTIFVNGRRAIRSREPDYWADSSEAPFYRMAGVNPATNTNAFDFGDSDGDGRQDIDAAWSNLSQVEVVSFRQWEQSREVIAGVDGNTVTFQGNLKADRPYGWDAGDVTNERYFVENVLEGVDHGGEWYYDIGPCHLYYKPRPGEGITNQASEILVPRVDQLVSLRGVSHVRFEDLTLGYTDWMLWQKTNAPFFGGYPGSQEDALHGMTPPSILATNCVRVAFVGDVVRETGFDAIAIVDGSNCEVVACEILHSGATAAGADRGTGHRIALNHIHHNGEVYQGNSAIGYGIGTTGSYSTGLSRGRIMNNWVHDHPYTGICGNGPMTQGPNLIQGNHIHDILRTLGDGGCIYCGWNASGPGAVIQANDCHDNELGPLHMGQFRGIRIGIYLDERATGFLVRGNLCRRTERSFLQNRPYGVNTLDSNIAADPSIEHFQINEANWLWPVPPTRLEHGVFAWTGAVPSTNVAVLLRENNFAAGEPLPKPDWNVYWSPVTPWAPGQSLPERQAHGRDLHSIQADPKLVNPADDDYRLRSDSPALGLGFDAPWLVRWELDQPQGLTVAPIAIDQINLSWNSVTNAAGYVVLRDGVAIGDASGTNYSDIGVPVDATYAYSVQATNAAGVSMASPTATITFVMPWVSPLACMSISNWSFGFNFRGASGWGYRVLATTNLMLPLSNWFMVGDGTFTTGSIDYAETITDAPQKFYRVVSP